MGLNPRGNTLRRLFDFSAWSYETYLQTLTPQSRVLMLYGDFQLGSVGGPSTWRLGSTMAQHADASFKLDIFLDLSILGDFFVRPDEWPVVDPQDSPDPEYEQLSEIVTSKKDSNPIKSIIMSNSNVQFLDVGIVDLKAKAFNQIDFRKESVPTSVLVGTFYYLNYISASYLRTASRLATSIETTLAPGTSLTLEFVAYASARLIDAQTRLSDEITRRGGLSDQWHAEAASGQIRRLSPQEAEHAAVPADAQYPPREREQQQDNLQYIDEDVVAEMMGRPGTSAAALEDWREAIRRVLERNQAVAAPEREVAGGAAEEGEIRRVPPMRIGSPRASRR